MKICIKGGRILDPAQGRDEIGDLFIEQGKIVKGEKGSAQTADRTIDASGCYVMPGLIDLHVHLRDPGQVDKEDIITGTLAAAHGGFTTIVAMPNTKPVIDEPTRVDYVYHKALQFSPVHLVQAGAITQGEKGEALADIEGMITAGIGAISEDGCSVMNAALYKKAMEIAAAHHIPVLAHCEDANLSTDRDTLRESAENENSLPGTPRVAEDVIIVRDIALSGATGAHVHLCHCSTGTALRHIACAKKNGIHVTAEVCPHHFILSVDDIVPGDSNYKMNPPLRQKEDVQELRAALADGTIDCISTDHAPHSHRDKSGNMQDAASGIVGLETAVPLVITELVEKGILTPLQMAEKMSTNPAGVLGIPKGTLAVGACADVTIIDPKEAYAIDRDKFVSRSRNTPFHGKNVHGKVKATICDGEIVWEDK